jgi:hypothetical protein
VDELLSKSYYRILVSKEIDDQDKCNLIAKMKYAYEDQDALIIDYLKNGCVDISSYAVMLQEKDQSCRNSDIQNKRINLWKDYYSTFAVSQDIFITTQKIFLEEYIDDLSPRDVYEAVKFLREVDEAVDLSLLLTKSIDKFVDKVIEIDFDNYMRFGWPTELLEMIKNKISVKKNPYSIKDLLNLLAGSNSWNSRYIPYLRKFTESDYYNWIVEESNVDVVDLLCEFVKRFHNLEGDDYVIIEQLRRALNRIKGRSNLDRLRVEYLVYQKQI